MGWGPLACIPWDVAVDLGKSLISPSSLLHYSVLPEGMSPSLGSPQGWEYLEEPRTFNRLSLKHWALGGKLM